ncbi:trypsin-7-like [Diabrotica undecimpunctata]|uniref:trypsin-7-like n=1 Tax=Diabrotica undecimpunctata TaxID=50387 RepID=UPI003B63D803
MGNFTWSIALVVCTLLLNNNPLADKQLRIFGGYEAKIEDHPWIVSLRYNSKHKCGGTLLNEDTVLTAAHCFDSSYQWSLYSILAGTHDITQPGTEIQVKDVKLHELYLHIPLIFVINDIAIIKLTQKVEFSKTIQPARLPNQGEQLSEGTPLLVAGWGATKINGTGSNVLKAAKVEVLPQETCNPYNIATLICAGDKTDGSNSGDSGGPLEHNGVVVGVVSYGLSPQHYGAYTSVAHFRTWIQKTAGI